MSENMDDGAKNPSADRVKRVDARWSDTLFDYDFGDGTNIDKPFKRLKCVCGSTQFEIIRRHWETIAHCDCGRYYIIHAG